MTWVSVDRGQAGFRTRVDAVTRVALLDLPVAGSPTTGRAVTASRNWAALSSMRSIS
ncbi:hypothetical protein OCAE111667_07235 [Occultella aeris]|uniref:Uncharacterized protein n=1 Tax=Occultella aeris TaxID=2761496 RepID=A0A7M4DRK2_9MICO|nr:hypothetical protein HALOF300_04797 [Occultella aeris]